MNTSTPFIFKALQSLLLFFFSVWFVQKGECQLPDLKLVEYHSLDTFLLSDKLTENKNYLLLSNAETCSLCHKALEEWVFCHEEWLCKYNIEVIGISTDGFKSNDQNYTNLFFQDLPYTVWYTDYQYLTAAFGGIGLPNSYFIENLEYIGNVGGYRDCNDMSDSLDVYFSAVSELDMDGDGVMNCDDCNDNDPLIPLEEEIPYNGIDDDCDVRTRDNDLDNDGFNLADDCDDNNRFINPNAPEVCNDLDDDCNGQIDDGLITREFWLDTDDDDFGNPDISIITCKVYNWDYANNPDDCDDTDASLNPEAEEIPNNGIDENCDGSDMLSSTEDIIALGFNLYPNPVSTDFLEIEYPDDQDYTLELYDQIGLLLNSYNRPLGIEMKDYTSGLYILKFRVGSLYAGMTKIVLP